MPLEMGKLGVRGKFIYRTLLAISKPISVHPQAKFILFPRTTWKLRNVPTGSHAPEVFQRAKPFSRFPVEAQRSAHGKTQAYKLRQGCPCYVQNPAALDGPVSGLPGVRSSSLTTSKSRTYQHIPFTGPFTTTHSLRFDFFSTSLDMR
jgi:hypothetical protein